MSESLRSPMPPRAGGSSTSSTCALCSPRRRPSCAAPSPGRSRAAPTTARTSLRRRTGGRRTFSAPGTKGAACTCGPSPRARCRRRSARPSTRIIASTTTTWSRELRGEHGCEAIERDGLSELVVIGGGPAGVTAALRARELGAEVILIEREKLGGTCTNDGCVPTRALAKAARLVRDAEQFADYGLRGLAPRVDFSRVLLSARRVVEEVHDKKRLRDRLEAAGVEVLDGAGDVRFADPHTVRLENGGPGGTEAEIRGDHF